MTKIKTILIIPTAIVAIVLASLWIASLIPQNLGGASFTATPGIQEQDYLLSATSSATARSDVYNTANAKSVTLFIGSEFHTGQVEQTLTFTVEGSDVAEPSQAAALYGTTTPLILPTNVRQFELTISTSTPTALANETFGTTTVSLDLTNHTYPFIRVVRTATTADVSTSTVSITKQY